MAKLFNPVKQWEVFNRCVRVAMQRKDLKTQNQLAAAMGMDRSAVNKRMSRGGWTVEETWRLSRVLGLAPEEMLAMMATRPS